MKKTLDLEPKWKKEIKIFFSLIPTVLNDLAKNYSPDYIKKLDYFLLLHYPNLWLTRVHFILPLASILILLSPLLGFFLAFPLQNHETYYSFVYGLYFSYLIFYAFWMMKDISPNKGGKILENLVCVIAVYFCIVIPYLVCTGFFWGYHYKIQSLFSEEVYLDNLEFLNHGTRLYKQKEYLFLKEGWSDSRNFYFKGNFFIEEIKDLSDRTEKEIKKEIVRYESLLDEEGNLLEKKIISDKGITYKEEYVKKIKSVVGILKFKKNHAEKKEKNNFKTIHILSEKALDTLQDYLLDYHYSKEIIQRNFWDKVDENKVGESLYFHWLLTSYFIFYISVSLVFLYFLITQFITKDKSWLWVVLFTFLLGLIVCLILFHFPTYSFRGDFLEYKKYKIYFFEILFIPYIVLLIFWLVGSYFTKRRRKFFYVGILFLLLLTPLIFFLGIELFTLDLVNNVILYWIFGTGLSLLLGAFLLAKMEQIQSLPE